MNKIEGERAFIALSQPQPFANQYQGANQIPIPPPPQQVNPPPPPQVNPPGPPPNQANQPAQAQVLANFGPSPFRMISEQELRAFADRVAAELNARGTFVRPLARDPTRDDLARGNRQRDRDAREAEVERDPHDRRRPPPPQAPQAPPNPIPDRDAQAEQNRQRDRAAREAELEAERYQRRA